MPFPVSAGVRAKADALQRDFVNSFNGKDLGRLSRTYTKEAKVMPAGAPIQKGSAAISAFFESVISSGVASVEITTDLIHASDAGADPDSLVECGRYFFYKADGASIDKGKYLAVLVKEGGEWKYEYDMFSSNGPMDA